MTEAYDDIINLPHHVSSTHPHMPVADRAAQFSPFAALTGYEAAVKEAARLTDKQIELDEYEKETLDGKLQFIADQLDELPEIKITYFQPDNKKAGGAYITLTGRVKKIDEYEHVVVMTDGAKVSIEEILDIDSELFRNLM